MTTEAHQISLSNPTHLGHGVPPGERANTALRNFLPRAQPSQSQNPHSLQGYNHHQNFLPNCLLRLIRSMYRGRAWYSWPNAAAQPQVLGYSQPSAPWASLTHGRVDHEHRHRWKSTQQALLANRLAPEETK